MFFFDLAGKHCFSSVGLHFGQHSNFIRLGNALLEGLSFWQYFIQSIHGLFYNFEWSHLYLWAFWTPAKDNFFYFWTFHQILAQTFNLWIPRLAGNSRRLFDVFLGIWNFWSCFFDCSKIPSINCSIFLYYLDGRFFAVFNFPSPSKVIW